MCTSVGSEAGIRRGCEQPCQQCSTILAGLFYLISKIIVPTNPEFFHLRVPGFRALSVNTAVHAPVNTAHVHGGRCGRKRKKYTSLAREGHPSSPNLSPRYKSVVKGDNRHLRRILPSHITLAYHHISATIPTAYAPSLQTPVQSTQSIHTHGVFPCYFLFGCKPVQRINV